MDTGKMKQMLPILGLALCLLVAAFSWPMMKFGGVVAELDFVDSDMGFWIASSYIIAEVAMIAVAGKLVDQIGMKRCMIISAPMFAIGAIGCAAADTIEVLVAFRVVQGIAGGLAFASAFSAPGILFRHGDRAIQHELMTGAFAIGSLFGAALGLYIALEIGWKWIFYITGILFVIGGILAACTLPDHEARGRWDIPGYVLMFTTVCLGMYYTQTVGRKFDMFSLDSLWILLAIIILSAALYFVERLAADPVFPRGLRGFRARIMLAILFIAIAVLGLLQFYVNIYVLQYADGIDTGIYQGCGMFAFLLLGGAMTSVPSGHKVPHTGIRPWAIAGCALCVIGLLLTAFIVDKGVWCMALCLFVLGLGLGSMITGLLISLQGMTPKEEMGSTSAFTMGMRVLCISVGLAIYSKYSSWKMDDTISRYHFDSGSLWDIIEEIGLLLSDVSQTIVDAFQQSAFVAVIFAALGLAMAFTMRKLDKGLVEEEEKE